MGVNPKERQVGALFRGRLTHALAAVSLALTTTCANAQFFGFGYLRTEHQILAGLDEPTRKLIEALPSNLRAEFVQGVRESVGLAEAAFDRSLTRLEKTVDVTLLKVYCTSVGVVRDATEEAKSVVFRGKPHSIPVSMEREVMQLGATSAGTASLVAAEYLSVVQRVQGYACTPLDPLVGSKFANYRSEVTKRYLLWNYAAGTCEKRVKRNADISTCFAATYEHVAALVKTADGRDLKLTNATAKFQGVEKRDVRPSLATKALLLFGQGAKAKPEETSFHYESEIEKLRTIETALLLAVQARAVAAGTIVNNDAWNESANTQMRNARAIMDAASGKSRPANDSAIALAGRVAAEIDPRERELYDAIKVDESLRPKMLKTHADLYGVRHGASELARIAKEYNKTLDTRTDRSEKAKSCGGKTCKSGQIADEDK